MVFRGVILGRWPSLEQDSRYTAEFRRDSFQGKLQCPTTRRAAKNAEVAHGARPNRLF